MDKYDRFLKDITEKTQSGALFWEPVSAAKYSDYIFHSTFAYQSYECWYSKDQRRYKLLFVNKKIPSPHEDLDLFADKHFSELLVFQEGFLLITLNDDYVDEEDLSRLGLAIEDKNLRTKELFEGFERSSLDSLDGH